MKAETFPHKRDAFGRNLSGEAEAKGERGVNTKSSKDTKGELEG
jgi:hypothetical protein